MKLCPKCSPVTFKFLSNEGKISEQEKKKTNCLQRNKIHTGLRVSFYKLLCNDVVVK